MKSFFDLFNDKNKTHKENMKAAADQMLLKLAVANSFAGRFVLPGAIRKEFNALGPRIRAGQVQLKIMEVPMVDIKIADLSQKVTSLTKDQIRDAIEAKLSIATDPKGARQKVIEAEARMKDMSEEEYAVMAGAIVAVLPPQLKKIYTQMALQGGDAEAEARRFYKMSIDERTQESIVFAKKIPVDQLVDAVYETCQRLTPQKLSDVLYDTWQRLDEKAAVEFVQSFFVFSEDFLGTVKKKNLVGLKDPAKGAAFALAATRVLTAIENSIVAAQVLPAPDKLDSIRQAFGAAADKPVNDNVPKQPPKFKNNGPV